MIEDDIMLNIKQKLKTIFQQSKNNDEGITAKQKKYFDITIPGCRCLPAYNSSAVPAQFNRYNGRYTLIQPHEIIAVIELQPGTTITSIKITGVPGDDWALFENNTALLTASGTAEQKINILVKENKSYYWYQEYMTAGNYIENIKLKYMI